MNVVPLTQPTTWANAGMQIGTFQHVPNSTPCGKLFGLDEHGNLIKEIDGSFRQATYRTGHFSTLADLWGWLLQTNSGTFLTSGISQYTEAVGIGRPTLPGEVATNGKPIISRNDECLPHRPQPGLMVVDVDGGMGDTLEAVHSALLAAIPQLKPFACLAASSTSSNLSDGNGTTYSGLSGAHLYFHVADTTDIPRALQTMHKLAILGGLEMHKLSETGSILIRSAVDLSMQVPSQPIYQHAVVSAPVHQTKQFALVGGDIEVLDTREIVPDLTPEQLGRIDLMIEEARKRMEPEAQEARKHYMEKRASELMTTNPALSRQDATAAVKAMLETDTLPPDLMIYPKRRDPVTVAEICANPEMWDGVPCKHPVDPNYGSFTTAKIFACAHEPHIASFAHTGGDKPIQFSLGVDTFAIAARTLADTSALQLPPGVTLTSTKPTPEEAVSNIPKTRDYRQPLEGEFIVNDKGAVVWCIPTALAYLEVQDEWVGVLAYDEFADDYMITKPIPFTRITDFQHHKMTDVDLDNAEAYFNRIGFPKATESIVGKAVRKAARLNTINPVKQYLSDIKWDGTPRLDMWLTTHHGAGDSVYTRAIGRGTLIGAVARVMSPGCKVDTMLILEGPQGINKSQALRVLAGSEYFTDSMPDLKNKDAADNIKGIWIVEMAELDMMVRSTMETTKAFLSRQHDRYRPSYGRTRIDQPRRCIFIGTTNQDNYLRDETGSRRFWPSYKGQVIYGRVEAKNGD